MVGVGSIVAVAVEFDCIAWSTYDGDIGVSGAIGEVGLCDGESVEGPASSGIASGRVDSPAVVMSFVDESACLAVEPGPLGTILWDPLAQWGGEVSARVGIRANEELGKGLLP